MNTNNTAAPSVTIAPRNPAKGVLNFVVTLIPRYTGDVPDPRGGIRHIIPSKARYW